MPPVPEGNLPPMEFPRWILSDTHFFHPNIAAYAGRPASHEDLMFKGWQETVTATDTLLHLGDVAFGSRALLAVRLPLLAELPGQVWLLRGNHDSRPALALYEQIGWRIVPPFTLPYRGWTVTFSHKPPQKLAPHTLAVHGHIHDAPEPSPYHINVSVEQLEYRPTDLRALLDARLHLLGEQVE